MDEMAPQQILLGLISPNPGFSNIQNFEFVDWTGLVELAYEHGVTSLLCRALVQQKWDGVPEDIRDACRVHLKSCAENNKLHANQLTEILSAFANESIAVIPFKGPSLALKAYGDLSLRAFRDLDILILREQIDPALEVLARLGYQGNHDLTPRQWQAFIDYAGQDILFGKGVPVEPHWEFAPSTLALDIDYQALWQRSFEAEFEGCRVRSFSTEDELVILCLHGCKEKWAKLKWVADVAWFVERNPGVNWELVFEYAEDQGVARIVRLGLVMAECMLGLQLPEKAKGWIETDTFACDWVGRIAADFFKSKPDEGSIYSVSAFHWKMRERMRDRLSYFFRTVTQPRVQHFRALKIPDPLFAAYFPLKLLHDYVALPIWKLCKKK